MTDYRILGITGSRPHKLADGAVPYIYKELFTRMKNFKKQGGEVVITGGAHGVDLWASEAALKAGLELHTYVPFPQQADKWVAAEQEMYRDILEKSQVRVFGDAPKNSLYFERNHAIVDDSDLMLAVYPAHATSGGAYSTMKYAQTKRKPIIHWRVYEDGFTQDWEKFD